MRFAENARLRAERDDLRAVVQAKESTIRGLEVAHANFETATQKLDGLSGQVVTLTRRADYLVDRLDDTSRALDRAYRRIRHLQHDHARQERLLHLHLQMTNIDRDLIRDLRDRADEDEHTLTTTTTRKRARSHLEADASIPRERERSRSPLPSPSPVPPAADADAAAADGDSDSDSSDSA